MVEVTILYGHPVFSDEQWNKFVSGDYDDSPTEVIIHGYHHCSEEIRIEVTSLAVTAVLCNQDDRRVVIPSLNITNAYLILDGEKVYIDSIFGDFGYCDLCDWHGTVTADTSKGSFVITD